MFAAKVQDMVARRRNLKQPDKQKISNSNLNRVLRILRLFHKPIPVAHLGSIWLIPAQFGTLDPLDSEIWLDMTPALAVRSVC